MLQLLASAVLLYGAGLALVWTDVELAGTHYVEQLPDPVIDGLDALYGWAVPVRRAQFVYTIF